MKTTTVLLCLLMVAAPASAGGVVLVLPLDASLEDVSAPDNATVASTVTAGHVVVSVTGPPGPVIVTGNLNGSAVVVAGYLPADAPDPVDLSPVLNAQASLLARLAVLEANVAAYAANASEGVQNASEQRQQLRDDVLNRIDAASSLIAAADARLVDLQNGTATVSGQIADLDGDVQAVADKKPPSHGHGGVFFLLVVVLLALGAQEARFWILRRRSGGMEATGDAYGEEGLSFADGEE